MSRVHDEAIRDRVLSAVEACGSDGATTADVADALGGTISPYTAWNRLRSLVDAGLVRRTGERRGVSPVFVRVSP